MALRGTLTHRKTRRLAARLKVDQCAALGYLEALWHVAAEQQWDGGIGRMSDQDIADEMFYSGDAAQLVEALTGAGWIDPHAECRLYIHDWHEHADDSVKNKLARAGQRFADGSIPNMRRLSKEERDKYARKYTESESVRIYAPAVRTDAHESAPPVPVPVPEPVESLASEKSEADTPTPEAPTKKSHRESTAGARFTIQKLPDEWLKWAIDILGWSGRTSQAVFERFADYWRSVAGVKGKKADWFATWRNWCRKEDESLGSPHPNGNGNKSTDACMAQVEANRWVPPPKQNWATEEEMARAFGELPGVPTK